MINRLLPGSALAALLFWNASVMAGTPECSASTGAMRTSLLELYTSEGCSSCPPADRWLSGLRARAGARLVPLAFHVDYWNQLGWEDRFSKPAYSARQRWIAGVNRARTIYTPQFVLDGRDWRPMRTGIPEPRDAQEAVAELRLKLAPAAGGRLEVSGEVRMRSRTGDARLFLALYENNLTSRIAAGENAGRLLRHDFVARELIGPIRLPAPGALPLQHEFSLSPDWKLDNLGVSAFVQDANTGEVYQALQRPVCKG